MRYDRAGDDHYDDLSALMKSIRGSDPDAAIHYLARFLEAGDLPRAAAAAFCAPRAEDIGLAYPQAIPIVKACVDSALQLGLPEARLPLADAVLLLATAPKSNSGCIGHRSPRIARRARPEKPAISRASFRTSTPTARALSASRAISIRTTTHNALGPPAVSAG